MTTINIIELIVSAIIVDTVIGYYLLITNKGGRYIKEWYKMFTIGAYSMDILSIVFATYISVLLTDNIYKQLLLVICIGLVHDITFGYFVKNSKTKSKIINLFKNYANELGITILIVDSLMLISTLLLAYFMKKYLERDVILLIGIIVFYIGLLMVYSF